MNLVLLMILTLLYLSFSQYKKDTRESAVYTTVCIIMIYVYFFVIWPQKTINDKVDNLKNIKYKKRMLWINMKNLDVMNKNDKKWANNILINDGPNKLGCYIDNKNVNNREILRHIEIFNIMFEHLPKYIKFKYKIDKDTKEFCKKKNLKIINDNLFRRAI